MISAWFDSHTYFFEAPEVRAWVGFGGYNRQKEYDVAWHIATKLLDDLIRSVDLNKPITIYSDSRIIEEINCRAEPLTDYGKTSLDFIITHYFPQGIFLFKKCSSEEIQNKIGPGRTTQENRI